MAVALPFTCSFPFLRLCRAQFQFGSKLVSFDLIHPKKFSFCNRNMVAAATRKNPPRSVVEKDAIGEESSSKGSKNGRRAPRRSKKIVAAETSDDSSASRVASMGKEEENKQEVSSEKTKKVTRRGKKKAASQANPGEQENVQKKPERKGRKKVSNFQDFRNSEEGENIEEPSAADVLDKDIEFSLHDDDGEDISCTYSWPPLVCCFGAAKYAFIPSGRPANRLILHDIHDLMKEWFWTPNKFVRAPGGPSSSVAIALAAMGGRVEFMGTIGDDDYGQIILYHLNMNKVQTRAVKIDTSKQTAISYMKILRRGGLRTSCVKPCAEDSFTSSDINIDVLKEAKMFYFNSSALLEPVMRSTLMQAIKISKKCGGVIFFDLNLPLPLWSCSEETKPLIQEAWKAADLIKVTKQELEFLCDIEPSEKFDTRDNDKSKFVHHKREFLKNLWHDDLKVLFVTNGTSKVHYYTEKHDGWVRGTEDPPITPFTSDMSVAGDAIVAGLMRILTVQPHLVTDKGYLEHAINYAIGCGVVEQWCLARVRGFPPKERPGISETEQNEMRSITEKQYRTISELVA